MIRLTKVARAGMIEILEHCKILTSPEAIKAMEWLQHYVDAHEVVGGKITHGGWTYNRRTYKTWQSMIQRCENQNHKAYASYGGRGISVCQEWQTFEGFFADMGNPPEGLSLDRVNNDLGYSKDNCRWATRSEQAQNRRTTIFVHLNGKRMSLSQACKEIGISYSTAKTRLNKGYPIEIVLSPENFMGKRNVGETGKLIKAEVIE